MTFGHGAQGVFDELHGEIVERFGNAGHDHVFAPDYFYTGGAAVEALLADPPGVGGRDFDDVLKAGFGTDDALVGEDGGEKRKG